MANFRKGMLADLIDLREPMVDSCFAGELKTFKVINSNNFMRDAQLYEGRHGGYMVL
jgi:hypothetical protein